MVAIRRRCSGRPVSSRFPRTLSADQLRAVQESPVSRGARGKHAQTAPAWRERAGKGRDGRTAPAPARLTDLGRCVSDSPEKAHRGQQREPSRQAIGRADPRPHAHRSGRKGSRRGYGRTGVFVCLLLRLRRGTWPGGWSKGGFEVVIERGRRQPAGAVLFPEMSVQLPRGACQASPRWIGHRSLGSGLTSLLQVQDPMSSEASCQYLYAERLRPLCFLSGRRRT